MSKTHVDQVSRVFRSTQDDITTEDDSFDAAVAEAVRALATSLVSPAEHDRNGCPANAVDGMFELSRAIRELAWAIRHRIW